MLRISLIVAVAAGLAAFAVGHLRVAEKIKDLRTTLTETTTSLEQSRTTQRKAESDLKKSNADVARLNQELLTTQSQLEEVSVTANEQLNRANDLEARMEEVLGQRNRAQEELAKWQAFDRSPEQIRAIIAENRRLDQENKGFDEENRILMRKLTMIETELAFYKGESAKVVLPAGLKGDIIAVDPRYDFVVLNIGEDEGVLERGELLVNRSGELIGKVRVLSVSPKSSIANILPDWKNGEVMEGDKVLVGI